jgi:hypothetical protein
MWAKSLLAAVLTLTTALVQAQIFGAPDEFKEIEVPTAPDYGKEGLIAIDMPSSSALKFGVDPRTVTIGSDGVLRYVMVAYNPTGSTNALYEGLRCATHEVKTYARSSVPGRWTATPDQKWRLVQDNSATRHVLALMRQGACDGYTLGAQKVDDMIRVLRTPRTSQGY